MNRFSIIISALCFLITSQQGYTQNRTQQEPNEYVRLSMELISSVKNNESYQPHVEAYREIDLKDLGKSLKTDQEIKAFWINTYNAFVQILLTEDPSLFDDRGAFFKADRVNVGDQLMSFDFMEHGIIRGSKVKLSMGFLKDPFASDLEKEFRVEETDGRVHFALNCGATSCPYVAVYSAYDLDNELDEISRQFLKRTTTYNKSQNEVNVTTLFSWFKGDFSERGGVIGVLKYYDCLPQGADPKVNYKDYDWTLDLGNFTEL